MLPRMHLRLRADLRVEPGVDGKDVKIVDPILERTVEMGALPGAVAQRLDGAHELSAIAEELSAPLSKVENAVRTLLLLNLVEGAGSEVIGRVAALRGGKASPLRVLIEGTRFGCIGSGDCCQSYHFGPLSDADLVLLDSLPIAESFPHAGPPPYWYERDLGGGHTGRFLRSVGDACLFLLDDCRCGLHAKFGFDKKPGLCRYYPYEQFTTIDGMQTFDKGGCSQYAVTSRSGPFLKDELSWIEPMLGASAALNHPVVLLEPKLPVDFGYVQPFLRAAVEEVGAAHGGAPETLRALGRRLRALVTALGGCALSPEAPTAAVAEVLAQPTAPFYADDEEEELKVGAGILSRVALALADHATGIIGHAHFETKEFYTARQSREVMEPLHLLASVAGHRADPSLELPEYYASMAAVSVEDPQLDEVLRMSMRQQLFGRGALIDDKPAPALLRIAFTILMALWGGRIRAARAGRTVVAPEDLSQGHMLANRVFSLEYNLAVFTEHEALVWSALEALPAVARWR
jgi:hypothetical protein